VLVTGPVQIPAEDQSRGPTYAARLSAAEEPRFVETPRGRIHYRRAGSGPPLLLLHSNGMSWHEFGAVIPMLVDDFDVIAWDMPGQGDSDPIPWRSSVVDLADLAHYLILALRLERTMVAGSSAGACIASSLAVRYPEDILAIALLEFQFGGPTWFAEHWALVEAMFSTPTMTREAVQNRLVTRLDDHTLARWNIDRNKAGSRGMLGVMWALREYDIAGALDSLKVPTLAVFGSQGPTAESAGAMSDRVAHRIETETISRCGHFPGYDRPDALADILRGLSQRAAS
jgi:3-oxoadipate enol-lactonase